jgi:hypothetical protein
VGQSGRHENDPVRVVGERRTEGSGGVKLVYKEGGVGGGISGGWADGGGEVVEEELGV